MPVSTLTDAEKAERDAKKEAAFMKLAAPRMNKTIKCMRMVTALGSNNYRATQKQKDMMVKVLRNELMEMENVFAGGKDQKKEGFSFDQEQK